MFERTNASDARGTTRPFELIGGPMRERRSTGTVRAETRRMGTTKMPIDLPDGLAGSSRSDRECVSAHDIWQPELDAFIATRKKFLMH